MKKFFVLLSVLFVLVSCEEEKQKIIEDPPPTEPSTQAPIETKIKQHEWEIGSLEKHFLDQNTIDKFHSEISKMKIKSALVVHGGEIVDEFYAEGFNANSIFTVHSCSKSITSALIGIAIEKGFIKDVNVTLAEYFPELPEGSPFRNVSLHQLLTNMSGIKTTEDNWYNWRSSNNWIEYIFNSSFTSKPGTSFSYSTGNTHLLSAVLERATGYKLFDFAKQYLFEPIGLTSAACGVSPEGVGDGGNGFRMTTRDMALFGLLYIRNGNLAGQQIISPSWISTSTYSHMKRSAGSNYGYQWWTNTFSNYYGYFANGHGEQFIFVIPDANFVIVFTSSYNDNSHFYQYKNFVQIILEAFKNNSKKFS